MESLTDPDGRRGRDPEVGFPDEGVGSPGRGVEDPPVSADDIFSVLYSDRRRKILEYLRDGDGTATASELAEHIAAAENDTTVRELSSYERKRVYISLYQSHLPMMDDANVVDYENNRKTVQLLETVEKLEPYLETRSVNRNGVIAGLLAIAATVLLGSFQVGVFASVSSVVWTIVGIVGLVGVACWELYTLYVD